MTEIVNKRSILGQVQDLFNVGHARKFIKIGYEISGAVQAYIDKPTVWNAGKCAFATAKAIIDDIEIWPESFFEDDKEWVQPFTNDFTSLIVPLLAKFPIETIQTADGPVVIKIVSAPEFKIGYTYNTKSNSPGLLYVEADKLEHATKYIKSELWNKFKNKSIVMKLDKAKQNSYHATSLIQFAVDDAFHPLPSDRAEQYGSYLSRCISAGVHRSVMFYGPPGTGKSTMCRTIVESLGLKSLRIRVEDISFAASSTLFEAITIFQPDAIILDDFDRCSAQAQLLESLEYFQRHVKLVIATVNNRRDLDEAILRPGRFDELIYVEKMEERVVKHILGEFVDGFDLVKDWPIAFICEYVKRRRFMSKDETENSIKELVTRVARLRKFRDDDDNEARFIEQNATLNEDDENGDFTDEISPLVVVNQ